MDVVSLYEQLLKLPALWRVERVELSAAAKRVDVWLTHDPAVPVGCPECAQPRPIYDHTAERTWRHLDTCEATTWLHARLPRVACDEHGVRQVAAPVADGSSRLTRALERRGIDTLAECSREGASRLTGLSWDQVDGLMTRAVARGLQRRGTALPPRVGVDEKQVFKRHRYFTLITDLDHGRVIEALPGRKFALIEPWFKARAAQLLKVRDIALDMSSELATLVTRYAKNARLNFDHFHVSKLVNEAVNEVRKTEQARIKDREEVRWFFRSRFLPLYNAENVPEERRAQFEELKRVAVQTSRAWAIKENYREVWECPTGKAAQEFFRKWYWWATHARLEPMRRVAHTLKRHWAGIRNAIVQRITNACTEGLNNKIEKVKRDAYGFRSQARLRVAILFHCGKLDLYPEPG